MVEGIPRVRVDLQLMSKPYHPCWNCHRCCKAVKGEGEVTSSASLKEKRDSSRAMVATRLTFARDWPTQLRGPSAKGM